MKRKPKPPIRFTASLPSFIREEVVKARVTKAVYDTLPIEGREYYTSWRDVVNPRNGRTRSVATTIYRSITPVAPYPNPAIERLKAKLTKQRVKFSVTEVMREVEKWDGIKQYFVSLPFTEITSEGMFT